MKSLNKSEKVGKANHFTVCASSSTAKERHVRVFRRVGRDNDVGAFSTVTSTGGVLPGSFGTEMAGSQGILGPDILNLRDTHRIEYIPRIQEYSTT